MIKVMCGMQLHWEVEDETFEGTVAEVDPQRAPSHTHVHYLADDDDEWGHFQGGVFHTADGDQRAVLHVTAPAAAPVSGSAASEAPQVKKSYPSGL